MTIAQLRIKIIHAFPHQKRRVLRYIAAIKTFILLDEEEYQLKHGFERSPSEETAIYYAALNEIINDTCDALLFRDQVDKFQPVSEFSITRRCLSWAVKSVKAEAKAYTLMTKANFLDSPEARQLNFAMTGRENKGLALADFEDLDIVRRIAGIQSKKFYYHQHCCVFWPRNLTVC